MKMPNLNHSDRIDRRAGQQGSRPSVGGRAEVEKYVTGHHYSEVTSSGWPKSKRHLTQKKKKHCTLFHHKVHIGSINTRTIKDPMKLAQCMLQCKFLKNDITFIQETHITGHQTTNFEDKELKGWTFINSGLKTKANAGVGIALSPNVKILDISNILEGRILYARLILHGIKISSFCAYAPTENYAESSKQSFFNTLRKTIQDVKRKHPSFKILIGADMNATIGCDANGSWQYLGTNNDNLETNDNGTRLLTLSEELELYIMNSLFDSKPHHCYTWYSPTGFRKRVDYILAEWHIKKLSSNCRVYRKASIAFETDHRFVALSCHFPSKSERKSCFPKSQRRERSYADIKSLKENPKVYDEFSKKLDELLQDEPTVDNVNTFERSFTESILKASEEQIPRTSNLSKQYPWTNEEFISMLHERQKCKDPKRLKELNKSVRKMRSKLKNEYFSDLAKNINIANESRKVEEEFRLSKDYRMMKKSTKHLISTDKLTTFFKDHFSEKDIKTQPEVENPENYPHILPPNDLVVNNDIPETTEVQKILAELKNGKCLGTDSLHAEHLKYNRSNRFLIYLTALLTAIWTTFVIPSSWLISSITCLFKNKGSRSEAENYRGISIMSTCSKILASLIISRFRNAYEKIISTSQFGFRANRSTTDAIFILQNALELSSRPLFLCFIDLKAAYDWINRDMLFKILEIRTASPVLVKILKALYTGTSAAIKGSKQLFQVFSGCRQGGIESPIIFNIYLDFVLRCAEHEILERFPDTGLHYSYLIPGHCSTRQQRSVQGLSGVQRLRMILYADDIVLLSNDIDELSEIVNLYDATFTRYGLKISINKTETMAFNVHEEVRAKPSLIKISGTSVNNVRKFKYLGHMITNTDEDPSCYLNFRITSAFHKWSELKHVLTDRKILISTRTRILEACVRSRLLYSVQAWEITSSELRKIESIWHNFLRRMIKNGFKRKNVPMEYSKGLKRSKKSKKENETDTAEPDDLDWSYIFSNDRLRMISKTSSISNFCKKQHLQYIAHITRLGNDSLQKQLLFAVDRKKHARDRWLKFEKELNITKGQIQKTMQTKTEFMSLLNRIYL